MERTVPVPSKRSQFKDTPILKYRYLFTRPCSQNGADRDARDLLLMTPLHWAVERGCVGAMEILLKHGASPDLESKFGKSPLDIASDNGRPDLYEILLVIKRTLGMASCAIRIS